MKRRILTGLLTLALLALLTIEFIPVSVMASTDFISISVKSNYDIPALTTYGWINAKPVMTDDVNYQWVNGSPYIIMTATTSVSTYDITNDPSTKAFGVVAVSTTYWAHDSQPNNPLDDATATYTITKTGTANVDVDFHGHNTSGGTTQTLVSTSPSANEYRIKIYIEGDAVPAGGSYLTTSDAEKVSNLSTNIDWDFSMETASSFGDGNQKTTTITLTSRAVS